MNLNITKKIGKKAPEVALPKAQETVKVKVKKTKEKKSKFFYRREHIALFEKAGLKISLEIATKRIFIISVIMNLLISLFLLYRFAITKEYSLLYVLVITFILWTLGLAIIIAIIWFAFYMVLDLKVYQRKIGIENVFPDFLQLTSANIRAGMPIDQALWHAIRPNFGVLAKEMEDVAKQTMSGTDLEVALKDFANRYDSLIIQRSVSLLIEGLNAGGEIGELLDKISSNIQETKLMQKEMASSVTTYAIFISFASILAAPFLMALSSQLLVVIEKIVSGIQIPEGAKMAISFSKVSVTPADFKIFAMTTLGITSALSGAIVATIKKGSVKAGMKYIPMFLIASILLFLFLDFVMGIFLKGMF